jgi:ElaB/YqjD/DUF883 family membrane-anchored ribosome-binding protein
MSSNSDTNVSIDTSDEDDNNSENQVENWRSKAMELLRKNEKLKSKLRSQDLAMAAVKKELENVRMDVINRSQKVVECTPELYKRVGEYAKQKLFPHIKFITSNKIMNNLSCQTSLPNITMNHFKIDVRDHISWW